MREDLGSGVGGPTTNAVLLDVGGIYYLGLGSVRVAVALSDFSSVMKPGGQYVSPTTGEVRSYDGFDPPTVFRYGVAFEPFENSRQRLTTALDFNLPADNSQEAKAGLEWVYGQSLALRTGYNFNADALKFSAGVGLLANLGTTHATVDYAYTTAATLGAVNRLSLGVRF